MPAMTSSLTEATELMMTIATIVMKIAMDAGSPIEIPVIPKRDTTRLVILVIIPTSISVHACR